MVFAISMADRESDGAAKQDDGCAGEGIQSHGEGHHDHDRRKGDEQVYALGSTDQAKYQSQDWQEDINLTGKCLMKHKTPVSDLVLLVRLEGLSAKMIPSPSSYSLVSLPCTLPVSEKAIITFHYFPSIRTVSS